MYYARNQTALCWPFLLARPETSKKILLLSKLPLLVFHSHHCESLIISRVFSWHT
jgi:hypothetical protein